MPHLFSYFPKTDYRFLDGQTKSVVDITRGIRLREVLTDRATIYYTYSVQDGDRPDTVASKYYEDSSLDWIVLLPNKILDPYWDWPRTNEEMSSFLRQKYGSVSTAKSTLHHYEKIVRAAGKRVDGTPYPEKTIVVDETTFNASPASETRTVYAYEHEHDLNESRRTIKLVDRENVPAILRAMGRAFRT